MLDFVPGISPDAPLRVLCLGAHSDDIEIGCGGTLLQLCNARPDVEVVWVVFSSGRQRDREARESAERFLEGVATHEIIVRDFRNGYFPFVGDAIKDFFEELKARYSPSLIFTHFRDDRHQDHRVVSDLTWNTFRDHCILEYEIPKYDGDVGRPNVFTPVSEWACRRKIDILTSVFATQRDKHWFDEATFRGFMRVRGMECCSPSGYAEAFHVRKLTLAPGLVPQHLDSEANLVARDAVTFQSLPTAIPSNSR
jgi:LmbE family N-acetylglucosaminyl deacetylase